MSIAVIVTTYNSSRVVLDALNSVAAQERLPDQVLVVDDGSTDNTRELVDAWAARQPFETRFLRNELPHLGFPTPGPAGSRTTGILHSNADLIAILDHDDMMLPCHLRSCEQALLRFPEMQLVFGDAYEFYEASDKPSTDSFFKGKLIEKIPCREVGEGLRVLTDGLMSYLIEGSFIPTGANMWRRETALSFGGFDRRAGGSDDVVFFSTLSTIGSVGYYPFQIAKRRIHHDNMSNPRHSLRHAWDQLNLLVILKLDAARLKFTSQEVQKIDTMIAKMEQEVLYHASRNGFSVYLDFKKRMGRLGRLRAKDLIRAAAFTRRKADLRHVPARTKYQMVGDSGLAAGSAEGPVGPTVRSKATSA